MCGVGLEEGVGGKEFEGRHWREDLGHKYMRFAASNVLSDSPKWNRGSLKFFVSGMMRKLKQKHSNVFDLDFYPQWRM